MIYVNHGNDEVCDTFAATVREKMKVEAIAPYSGDEYDSRLYLRYALR